MAGEGAYLDHECSLELSIMDIPLKTVQEMRVNDGDLEELINPNKLDGATNIINAVSEIQGTRTVFDHIHPNCMVFNENGRLFVGDSKGQISFWDISIAHGNLVASNYTKLIHKELEGDEIN